MQKIQLRIGRQFGRLTVVSSALPTPSGHTAYKCACRCGNEKTIRSVALLHKNTRSCGCLSQEIKQKRNSKCRICKRPISAKRPKKYKGWCELCYRRWRMFAGARTRAKRDNTPFTIKFKDIPNAPAFCPVFGIRLRYNGNGGRAAAGLDRIDTKKGYIPGNLAIISGHANRLKNSATIQEVEQILSYMKTYTK